MMYHKATFHVKRVLRHPNIPEQKVGLGLQQYQNTDVRASYDIPGVGGGLVVLECPGLSLWVETRRGLHVDYIIKSAAHGLTLGARRRPRRFGGLGWGGRGGAQNRILCHLQGREDPDLRNRRWGQVDGAKATDMHFCMFVAIYYRRRRILGWYKGGGM
jgi:hypothetical protein